MNNEQSTSYRITEFLGRFTKSWATRLTVITLMVAIKFVMIPTSAFAIIGGSEATDEEQPWMVGISLADVQNGFYAQFCGGTLIDPHWVLTAAHCMIDENNTPFDTTDLDVIIGRTRLSGAQGQRIAVTKIVVHGGFDLATYNNDIALLRLERPVDAVTPVRLATSTNLEVLTVPMPVLMPLGTIYGWGITDDGKATDILNRARIPFVDEEICQTAYTKYDITLSDNMLCAGYAEGGVDSCVGDSGGPLVYRDNDEIVQVGLVSWGLECGAPGLYGVYTKIASYTNWIQFQLRFYR